jgi:uncharacterized cysteine cluster protein YcgN (CxxCxxCC family)
MENLCKRCGKCCYFKTALLGVAMIDYGRPCPFLNKDNTCMIYENRAAVPWCNGAVESMQAGPSLPDGCPYLKFQPAGYETPLDLKGEKQ